MVRQYQQFMALMNNYDYFKENVGIAEGSEGTLQKQADIYAESWEAASKRVRASAESLYQDLIDDKFFISINNGIANVLSGLDAFIDKAGGLKTVITAVSGVFLSAFASKIPDAIKTVKYNLEVLTGGSQKVYQNIFKEMEQATKAFMSDEKIDPESSMGMQLKQANALSVAKSKYTQMESQLSEIEKQRYSTSIDLYKMQSDELIVKQKQNEETRKNLEMQQEALGSKSFTNYNRRNIDRSFQLAQNSQRGYTWRDDASLGESFNAYFRQFQKEIPDKVKDLNQQLLKSFKNGQFDKKAKDISIFGKIDTVKGESSIEKMFSLLEGLADKVPTSDLEAFRGQMQALQNTLSPTIREITGLDSAFEDLQNSDAKHLVENVSKLKTAFERATIPASYFEGLIKELNGDTSIDGLTEAFRKLELSETEAKAQAEVLNKNIKELDIQHTVQLSEAFASLASGIMNAYTIVQSFASVIKSIDDDDLNIWEKIVAIVSGLTSISFSLNELLGNASKLGTFIAGLIPKLGAWAAGLTGVGAAIAPIGIGIAAIAAAGAALWVIVEVFKAIKKNSPEGQLESAKKATEELTEQVNKAKQAYSELQNTIESYKTAKNNLDSLKTGTVEFTDALIEANEKAWELIRTLGLTDGNGYTIGENGIITIDFDSNEVEQGIRNKQEQLEDRQAGLYNVQTAQAQKQYEVDIKTLGAYIQTDYSGNKTTTIDDIYKAFKTDVGGYQNIVEQLKSDYNHILEDGRTSQYWSRENIDKYGKILGYSQKELEIETYQNNVERFLNNIISGKLNIQELYNQSSQLPITAQQNATQSLMYSLSDEEAYQNSKYGGQIAAAVAEATTETLTNELKSGYANKTDNEINSEFETWARNRGYYVEDGKIYEDSSKKTEVYGNYTRQNKEDALIGTQVTNEQESDVLGKINELNNAMANVPKNLKPYAEALASGGDITKLTQEQIEYIKSHGGKIESTLDTSFDSIASVFGDSWQDFIDKINNAVKTYKPGDEFDLDSWKTKYNSLQEIISKVSSGGTIDTSAYNQLDEQYQQYFSEQIDGNYKLIGLASEFKKVVESTEIGNLKESQSNSLNSLFDINEKLRSGIDYSTIEGYTNGGNIVDTNLIEAMGMEVPDSITDQVAATKQAAQAYIDLTAKIAENSSVIAQLSNNYKDLDENFKKGYITVEDYNKKLKELNATLDEDVDETTYEHLTKAIQGLAEEGDLDKLGAEEFSQDLKDDAEAAGDAAEAILRYDKAVERVKKNQKDWQKILKSGNLQEVAEITDDLANSYEDLLNLSKGALSDSFVTDAENLDLLTQAANGSSEAYDKLAERASQEIIAECKLNTNFNQEKFNTALADFQSKISSIDLPNLEVGTKLDGVDGFLAACEQLVNAAGMTATQAQNYLMSMGIDAEVTEDTQDVEEQVATEVYSTGVKRGIVRLPYSIFGTSGENMIQTYDGQSYGSRPVMATRKVKGVGLKVSNAHVAAGGNVKFNNSSNGGGSKGSSGGGGGGGSKSTTHADSKSFSDQDRYHTVKNQLEDLNSQYDALDKVKDRAFGKSKIDAMDAEIAKTDELINKQKEYLREIEDYLPKDKAIMEKAYNEYIGGPGIEYDALGNISNFDAIQDAMFNKYNEMAGAYTDDSDEWKIFEKKYELLEKYIKQYEETYDLLRDERDKMQELINQKIDLGLEKVQYQVEVALEVPDDAIKVLEYRIGRIDDDAEKSLEAVSLLTKKAEQVYDKIQLNKQALNDVLKLSMSVSEINEVLAGNTAILAGKTFTEDQIDALKDYRDALIDLNGEFDDIRDNIEGKVMDVFDKWKEKLNTGIDTIEHYGNTLSSFHNIIDIVGKETLGITGDLMNKLAQSTVDVAIDKLKGTKRTYETIMASRDEAERRLQEAQARNDEASVKLWQENLETINEEVRSANEEMMQAWEDALSSIADNFENTVNDLVDTFQKSVYVLGGLDGLSDDFSRQQENADLMLDDYQKIYELSKLSRDINKTIDDTDIISGKQKLKKLLGQINDLQADGNEMSKYDLEYLQKTYDLRLAEIELEEAQRAKNTVRLQKDSEGNWSYIYTQSSDAIDSAQQKYEDALYAMQDLSSNYIDEMSEKLISTSKDMEEALAAIRIQDYANIDDYYAEVERVQNKYQEQMDMQQNELQKAIDNNKELYDTDWTNYHNATGYKISDTEDFVTSFKDSLLGTLMDSESDAANFTDIIGDSVYNLTLGLMQAAETYYKNIEDAMNAAGTSTGDFAEDASENIDKVVDKSKEGTEAINDMAEQMTTAFDNITESVSQWQENYGMAMEKIIQSNLDVVESFNNMLAAMSISPDNITIKYDISNSAKDQKLSSFDTGGYTGEWDANGKLAVLHQKELVLNENDTANMLAVVQFTRSILDTIDLNAKAASLGLGTLSAIGLKDSNEQTLQQDVHITAEFPNVTNHTEIEEAMENLINHASQYVNRK